MDSRKYLELTVIRTRWYIAALVLIATACAGLISSINDKTISRLIIIMFIVCVVGILSLLLLTQLLTGIIKQKDNWRVNWESE